MLVKVPQRTAASEKERLKLLKDKREASEKKVEKSGEVYWVNGEAWQWGKKMKNQARVKKDEQDKLDRRRSEQAKNSFPKSKPLKDQRSRNPTAAASIFFQ